MENSQFKRRYTEMSNIDSLYTKGALHFRKSGASPERNLLSALIIRTVQDQASSSPAERFSAKTWLYSDLVEKGPGGFTLRQVCEFLGLKIKEVRRSAREFAEKTEKVVSYYATRPPQPKIPSKRKKRNYVTKSNNVVKAGRKRRAA